jgi:eukaryotic-like serine/threonine-protein kinase
MPHRTSAGQNVLGHVQALHTYDPSWIGPFRLLGRLGADGMGQVYLGEGPNERRVAVKVVHPGLAHDERFRVRLARGVDVSKRVTAPWTTAVVDADPHAPQPWLATEYVPGPSLEDAVHSAGVLPRDRVHVLAVRLALALAGIHAAGLLHRDVKPSNVLLAADGPRLIDFGIAQAVDGTRMTSGGMVAGTRAFMSPEQADGAEIGPASDVFSLGAVLVFAATGAGPFGDGRPAALLSLGAMAEPVRGLVARCLARDPADRPTAAELVATLNPEPAPGPPAVAALPPRPAEPASGPGSTPPETAPHPTHPAAAPGARRIGRRALLTATALVGLGGIGAVAGISWTSRPQPAVRWSYTANGDVLAVATDGATVFATGADSTVYAIDVATGQPRWTHAIGQPRGEDTKSLAVAESTVYASDDRYTYAIDAASGARRWAVAADELLTADPTTVVFAGYDEERRRVVAAVDPATGSQRWARPLVDIRLGASSPPELAALSGSGVHLIGGATLVTLDLAAGTTLWSRRVTGDRVADGLVATPDTVFLTDPRSNSSDPPPVLALDAQTGVERWIVESSASPDVAPRLVTGNTVYSIGLSEAAAFDAATGKQRWTWSDEEERNDPLAPDNAWSLSGPAIDGETLVVLADTTPAGSHDNHQCVVIALSTKSGKSQWRLELPPFARGSAAAFRKTGPVAAGDGSLVVSVGHELYAIAA